MPTNNPFKDLFLLDPSIHFLNHGSFGACPRPVFEAYQEWQRRVERQPVLVLGREYHGLMKEARQALGAYLRAPAEDLVYVPNATHGVSIVARSLRLAPGDEVVSTDHEYGACDYAFQFTCGRAGTAYRRQPAPLPLPEEDEFVERLWQAVTPRTRLIFLSHITSPTAATFPVEAVCRRARQEGILTLVDGAHAPGQLGLDLTALGADYYTGNCHKWMLAPKGAGFLYARPEAQPLLEPLAVSWGYGPWGGGGPSDFSSGSRFIDLFEWTGTKDPAAALSVPAAIEFMQAQSWPAVREECRALLSRALAQVSEITGLPCLYPGGEGFVQMAAAELPLGLDLLALKARLYDEYRVEAPLTEWGGRSFVRISVQAYNTEEDIAALAEGLHALLG